MQLSTISLIVYESGTFVFNRKTAHEKGLRLLMTALEFAYNYYLCIASAVKTPMKQTDFKKSNHTLATL